jgi:hypothetical protein
VRRDATDPDPRLPEPGDRGVMSPGEPVGSGPLAARDGISAETAPVDWAVEPEGGFPERGLRGLIGGGASQVRPTAAMRARDSARPTAADLAWAEANLTIVRRHWTPREGSPAPPK